MGRRVPKEAFTENITMKNITYYVQWYRPQFEAISKEIQLLADHFQKSHKVMIHDLHFSGVGRWEWSSTRRSFPIQAYPFLFLSTYLQSRRSHLNHIYTSLGDTPYLPLLNPQRTILTAAASCHAEKVKRRLPWLKEVQKIVVETERQKNLLLELGISPGKIAIIPPAVDLSRFSFYQPELSIPFTVLYASCPTREKDFQKRGIPLLLETAKESPEVRWHLAWRGGAYEAIQILLQANSLSSPKVNVSNEIVSDLDSLYAKAHVTIIPYTKFDDYLKLMPNSAIESLAAGKPLLVSSSTEIASLVAREQCGVVFQPTKEGLLQALGKVKKNYGIYQRRCRPTAEKYFSHLQFLKKYEEVYAEILQKVER